MKPLCDHHMTTVVLQGEHTEGIKAPVKIPVFSQNNLEFRVWSRRVSNTGPLFTLSIFRIVYRQVMKNKRHHEL